MNPVITSFQADHVIDFMQVDEFLAQRAVMAERNIAIGGLGWSAMLDGQCIGCAIILKESARYTIWVNTTPELLHHKLWFHKTAQKLYQQVREHAAGMPIQILCDASVAKNMKWAKKLGFRPTSNVIMEAV